MTTAEESDQVVQRRANLEELRKLGVNPYPHRFDSQATIEEIVRTHGEKSGEVLRSSCAGSRQFRGRLGFGHAQATLSSYPGGGGQ